MVSALFIWLTIVVQRLRGRLFTTSALYSWYFSLSRLATSGKTKAGVVTQKLQIKTRAFYNCFIWVKCWGIGRFAYWRLFGCYCWGAKSRQSQPWKTPLGYYVKSFSCSRCLTCQSKLSFQVRTRDRFQRIASPLLNSTRHERVEATLNFSCSCSHKHNCLI